MIGVVDYGVGNIQAFLNLFKRIGVEAFRADKVDKLDDAKRLVLPGVGHFDHAMQKLNDSGFRSRLEQLVLDESVPILGICVGMQMLATSSDEGSLPGLNWIPGHVRLFEGQKECLGLPMPHMGWNDVQPRPCTQLFSKVFKESPEFYFLHSYYFDALDSESVSAKASYGIEFAASVSRSHIHGVQFHPEKSHHWGEQLIKNFVEL